MTFDAHANFGYSTVAVAPSPASSGTSLTVQVGDGANFPAAPFNCTVWPAGAIPLVSNAEIVRVTAIVGDVLTISRTQEGSAARSIIIGDQIDNSTTKKVFTDIEGAIPTTLPPNGPAGGDLSGTYPNPGVSQFQGQSLIQNSQLQNNSLTVTAAGSLTGGGAVALGASVTLTGPAALPPNGSAGGDLSGSYPNPTVAKIQGNPVKSGTPGDAQALIYTTANNDWEAVSFSGDFTITHAGVATIGNNVVTNAKLAQMIGQRIKGNASLTPANASDLTGTNVGTILGSVPSFNLIIPRGGIDGLILANNGAGSQSLQINPGSCRDSTNAADISSGGSGTFFKSLAGTWVVGAGSAGAPVNGLDTGAVAASTWYHVFAINKAEGGTPDFLFSLSATAPTMPATYNFFECIGSVLTDGSSHIIAFHQYGDFFFWDVPAADGSGTIGTAVTQLTVSAPPRNGVLVFGNASIQNAAVGVNLRAWSRAQGDGSNPAGSGFASTQVANVAITAQTPFVAVDSSSKIDWNASANTSTVSWFTIGWIDPRGKNSTANV